MDTTKLYIEAIKYWFENLHTLQQNQIAWRVFRLLPGITKKELTAHIKEGEEKAFIRLLDKYIDEPFDSNVHARDQRIGLCISLINIIRFITATYDKGEPDYFREQWSKLGGPNKDNQNSLLQQFPSAEDAVHAYILSRKHAAKTFYDLLDEKHGTINFNNIMVDHAEY
jgi:hypothetical protein